MRRSCTAVPETSTVNMNFHADKMVSDLDQVRLDDVFKSPTKSLRRTRCKLLGQLGVSDSVSQTVRRQSTPVRIDSRGYEQATHHV